ncbi:FAD-dependent oxidoreductase [Streptosporangium vulgare]|uniref:D-amino-acid oxidase n=1 Tax=Streptosporangium vulgare TaxID=46190 RepID=A0ABV5TA65_9ACTN
MKITVVGAGVIGLTTALRLKEMEAEVSIIASELPQQTSSAVAAALWGPFRAGPPGDVARWSSHSLRIFRHLAEHVPAAGVRISSGIQAARRTVSPPVWHELLNEVAEWTPCAAQDMPEGFVMGWRYSTPMIEMPTYLSYLQNLLSATGTKIEQATLTFLEEAGQPDLLVNCSGYGAAELAVDPLLRAVRGDHLVVENPGLTDFFSEDRESSDRLTAIYPHRKTVILSGTAIDDVRDRTPDPAIGKEILARCREIDPRLGDASIVDHRVGIRPVRPTVRLEVDRLANKVPCVHNYGHGGAGVTLSWGCAEDVLRIAQSLL